MFCPKCGEKNIEGASFCSKCGSTLSTVSSGADTVVTPAPNQNTTVNPKPINQENVVGTIFKHMISGVIKPFTSFNKLKDKLETPKYALIYAGIVSGIMWILSVISQILVSARTYDYSLWSGSHTTFNFARVNYVRIIVGGLFIYVGLVAATAGVFTLACLIAKKKGSFFKFLAITSTAILPYAVASVFLAPLLGMLHFHIEGILSLAGILYSFLIFIGLVNDDIEFQSKEARLLFYFGCIGSICIVFYFLFYYVGASSVSSLGSIDLYDYLY